MSYDKQCWFCGKVTMVNKGGYFQCSSCGATWNALPTLGAFIDIERHFDGAEGQLAFHPVKKRVRVAVKAEPPRQD